MREIVTIPGPGTYIDSQGRSRPFSLADLQASAAAYDASLHEAPIVIGHPKHDAPSYGWLNKARVNEEGALVFESDRVNPDFAEMHKAGAFPKHSLSLYPPDDPRNPKPGVWYPRHLGFLGAMPPAIKGLPEAQFAEGDDPVEIEFGEVDTDSLAEMLKGLFGRIRDLVIDKFGREEADRTIPDWEIDHIQNRITPPEPEQATTQFSEETPMSETTETVALSAEELDAREAAIKAREDKIAAEEAEARRAAAVAFAESLADQGKILPRSQPAVVELMLALPADEVEFAEGDETRQASPDALFRELMAALPEAIDFSEKSGGTDTPVDASTMSGDELAKRARKVVAAARSEGRSVSFTEAVDEVLNGAES